MIRLLGLAAVLLPVWAFAQPGPPPVPVTTDAVRSGDVAIEVLANGVVQSESVVTIRTRVDGAINEVHVQEGDFVRRGQVLFTLDSRLTQAILAQQEAQLARDRAQATRAQSDADRYRSLRGESFASQQRFEQAVADAAAAAATVRATEAIIQQTRLNLEFSRITADVDGRLGALPLRAGNVLRQAENTPLGTITQVDPVLVQFNVPERWLPRIRASMQGAALPVHVRADGDAGAPVRGELIFVDSQVDTATGTIGLKARFINSDQRLWPGAYVRVALNAGADQDVLTVAAPAVQTGQQGRFVFVAEQGVARRRSVELVRVAGERAVVRGQLRDGERVIVDGAQRVSDGARIQDRSATPPGPRVSALETR
ncbi:MAG: efflux RND transporter periplasmic adaptor subunit [Alphaproteobacteria bacterium]|nr:efflux RND transporter periplasmic adaptor subunit [Alphaproteobacteria bacterium]